MAQDQALVEVLRGGRVESIHRVSAVICDGSGEVIEAWGNPDDVIFPRSSCKMVQALPLLESGAGSALTTRHLALACASHKGADMHVDLARAWLRDLDLTDDDLRCGPQWPSELASRDALIRAGEQPCQVHNNCSGKHCGFLMLARHLGADLEYNAPDHPVQQAVRRAFEEVTEMESPGFGIDGCSAPNFATRLDALAGAMGRFARAQDGRSTRETAMVRLREAMATAPELVAGEGRACTDLMRSMEGAGIVKTGAEGVFVAILPGLDRGIALKATDGATRAAEALIAALLVRLEVLSPQAAVTIRLTHGPIRNWRQTETGHFNVVL